MNALEGPNALNYTLWTYVPDNCHEWGDLWYVPPIIGSTMTEADTCRNGEDLSIWSKDDKELPSVTSSSETQDTTPIGDRSNASIATSTTLTSNEPSYTPEAIQDGTGVTADLIINGARAVGAICRPFPVSTVGEVKQADFDLTTSTFKLAVRVRPDDPSGVSTQIYVPFVHYARSLQSNYHDSKENGTGAVSAKGEGLEMDVQVRITHGSYSLQGQYLTWTYPLPKSETVYSIEISRNGGAIIRDTGYGGGGARTGSWSDVCGGCVIS